MIENIHFFVAILIYHCEKLPLLRAKIRPNTRTMQQFEYHANQLPFIKLIKDS